ncbi:MAG: dienelactone hydrolase family protein [Actinomycetota bacterium]
MANREVLVPAGPVEVEGSLHVPDDAVGVVAFAHGTGSGRHSPRNRAVAATLGAAALATLLIDLLTEAEEREDLRSGHLRFDIGLLAERLGGAGAWLQRQPDTAALGLGFFGASTGAAAALVAAARSPQAVRAVVSRGGRPDLAGDALPEVRAPTLLIVGSLDEPVIGMNREAMSRMSAPVELRIVDGASHLFEEPGTMDQVAALARDWFAKHLPG